MIAAEVIADMEILRHMLGMRMDKAKRDWGYRNYFNSCEGHSDMPSLLRLEAAGLIKRSTSDVNYWHATEAGCKAIGLNAAQIKRAFAE